MSKRQPKRSDAAQSLAFWAVVLNASVALPKGTAAPATTFPCTNYAVVPAPSIAMHELAYKLARLAAGESVRTVFGRRPPTRRPGRPRALEAAVWKYLDLRAQGHTKKDAAKKVGRAVATMERHGKKKVVGRVTTSQAP